MKFIHIKGRPLLLIAFIFISYIPGINAQSNHGTDIIDLNLRVLSPSPGVYASAEGYTITADDKIAVTLNFNWPVDISTVIAGRTVIMVFPKDGAPKLNLEWSNNNKTLVITTVKTRSRLLAHQPDAYFKLTLRGNPFNILRANNEPVMIKSAGGKILDGDYDDKEGGNYVISFISIG